jgi:hypothetical protein
MMAWSLAVFGVASQHAAQDSISRQQADDQSFYLGKPVPHPEELSGVWETPDGHGGAIGLHLMLFTTAPVDATTLVGAEQAWQHFVVGVYHRVGPALQSGEESTFSDSSRGGGVRYQDGQLTLHSGSVDLDLRRVDENNWSGRVHCREFDSQVKLSRPETQAKSKHTWLVGTWREESILPGTNCLHVVETSPGLFAGWSDYLLTWGNIHFGPDAKKPPYSLEHYGDLVNVRAAKGDTASIELGAYVGVCCPHAFVGSPTKNGAIMRADWPAGPNQTPHMSEWTKMRGNSCILQAEQPN